MIRAWFEHNAKAEGITGEEWGRRFCEETIPLGRSTTPDEVAGLVVFLASSESDFMTGQSINITGGLEFH